MEEKRSLPEAIVLPAPVKKKSSPKTTPYSIPNIENEKEIASLHKALAESQQALTSEKEKWQRDLNKLQQQLAEGAQAGRDSTDALASVKQQLAESQRLADEQKKQIATLTATQVTSALELAAAKSLESQAVSQLKMQLAESQKQASALTKQIDELTLSQADSTKAIAAEKAGNSKVVAELKQSLSASQNETATLKASLMESQKQRDDLDKKWQEATGKVSDQEKQLAELSSQKPAVTATPEPKTENEIRAYALGTLWGQEVAAAMEKVKADGIVLDLKQVNSGVADSINDSFRLPQQKIIEVLDALNKQVINKQRPVAENKFIQTFSKKPGTKRAEMGYYYRIVEKGQNKIGANDRVTITVKESLSNGKVIKDMAKTGKVLTLPVANFPPLFSTAIALMNNKGKLQMAVPPELAYGEQGRPPQIPPGSTMVYDITVLDVAPAASN